MGQVRGDCAEAPAHNLSKKQIFGPLAQEAFPDSQAEWDASPVFLRSTKHTSITLHMPVWNW